MLHSMTLGNIICKKVFKFDASSFDLSIKKTVNAINYFKQKSLYPIKAIGIGIPGVVLHNNVIVSIPSIPSWEGVNIKEILSQKIGHKIFLENDVKLATIGCYYNQFKDFIDSMVYIYIGKGLGSGIIYDGKLLKGFNSFAGEIAYLPVNGTNTFEEELKIRIKKMLA